MHEFHPVAALLGGILIGVGALVLLIGAGRLAGVSNIAYGLVDGLRANQRPQWLWRLLFILGLTTGAGAYFLWTGAIVNPRHDFSRIALVIGGLLVGYGTSMGNGCTSGHGVCGLGRASPRSLVATLVFMLVAIIVVYVVRHG